MYTIQVKISKNLPRPPLLCIIILYCKLYIYNQITVHVNNAHIYTEKAAEEHETAREVEWPRTLLRQCRHASKEPGST